MIVSDSAYILNRAYISIILSLSYLIILHITLVYLYQLKEESQTMQFDYLLKFIVVGDTGVGKSSVVMQFMEQKINANHQITIGVEFATRLLEIKGKTIKLQVWDTAGQQNFKSITRSYYRSAIGALLIYDITKYKSFQHLQDWIKEIRSSSSNQLEILVIGNKNDLENERQVSVQEGRKFSEDNQLKWIQISAKSYGKVEQAFLKLSNSIVKVIERGQIDENTPGVKINQHSRIDPLGQRNKRPKICC